MLSFLSLVVVINFWAGCCLGASDLAGFSSTMLILLVGDIEESSSCGIGKRNSSNRRFSEHWMIKRGLRVSGGSGVPETKNRMLRRQEFHVNDSNSRSFDNILGLRGGGLNLWSPLDSSPTHKIIVQVALSLLNVLCWYLPLKVDSFASYASLLSLAYSKLISYPHH